MRLGKMIRALDVEFDEARLPPLEEAPDSPSGSTDPEPPAPVPGAMLLGYRSWLSPRVLFVKNGSKFGSCRSQPASCRPSETKEDLQVSEDRDKSSPANEPSTMNPRPSDREDFK